MESIFYFEIIGTIIFALQGCLVAVERKLDILGMIVLGVTTAVGGGMIRDILLGRTPPTLFQSPIYAIVAVITCLAVILCYKYFVRLTGHKYYRYILKGMLLLDAVGLGIFTVVGTQISIDAGYGNNLFLCSFVGVMTGVGGGLLRDMMGNRVPVILKKEIYAVASIIGAVSYCLFIPIIPQLADMYLSATFIIILRLVSVHKNIHLPTLKPKREDMNHYHV